MNYTPIDHYSNSTLRRMANDPRDLSHEAATRELDRRNLTAISFEVHEHDVTKTLHGKNVGLIAYSSLAGARIDLADLKARNPEREYKLVVFGATHLPWAGYMGLAMCQSTDGPLTQGAARDELADVTCPICLEVAAATFGDMGDEEEVEECEGHESLNGADMGVTVYCDGTCRIRPAAVPAVIVETITEDGEVIMTELKPDEFVSVFVKGELFFGHTRHVSADRISVRLLNCLYLDGLKPADVTKTPLAQTVTYPAVTPEANANWEAELLAPAPARFALTDETGVTLTTSTDPAEIYEVARQHIALANYGTTSADREFLSEIRFSLSEGRVDDAQSAARVLGFRLAEVSEWETATAISVPDFVPAASARVYSVSSTAGLASWSDSRFAMRTLTPRASEAGSRD